MPERILSADEAERLLRDRPPAAEVEAKAKAPGKVYTAAEAAKLRGGTATSADGKPALPPTCPACAGFLPLDACTAPNKCPKCGTELPPAPAPKSARRSSKPARHPGAAFGITEQQFHAVAAACAERAAVMVRPYIAGLKKQIAELKNGGAGEKVSLSHYDAAGLLVAEFWQTDGKVTLRVGGKATTVAVAGSARAKKLLEKFEDMAPI
jgi:hypothetical protein